MKYSQLLTKGSELMTHSGELLVAQGKILKFERELAYPNLEIETKSIITNIDIKSIITKSFESPR